RDLAGPAGQGRRARDGGPAVDPAGGGGGVRRGVDRRRPRRDHNPRPVRRPPVTLSSVSPAPPGARASVPNACILYPCKSTPKVPRPFTAEGTFDPDACSDPQVTATYFDK